MNREQRRKGATINIAERDKRTELVTTKRVMFLVANELQSKYGWGKKRINILMAGVVNTADCINGNFVNYAEIEKEIKGMGVMI